MQEGFGDWLQANNYRVSTVRSTLTSLRGAHAAFGLSGTLDASNFRQDALRRYATFVAGVGVQSDFDQAVLDTVPPVSRQHHAPKAAPKHVAVSFVEEDWFRLTEAISADDAPEARVLQVQFVTGYRISDVLGIERERLKAALRSGKLVITVKGGHTVTQTIGGNQALWTTIFAAWPKEHAIMAEWVCPRSAHGALGGMGAYQRVNRYFKHVSAEQGVDSRVHLHRIRRTVGTRAIAASGDIHLVKQLLGHRSIASTELYLTELRADEVSQLQQKLRKR